MCFLVFCRLRNGADCSILIVGPGGKRKKTTLVISKKTPSNELFQKIKQNWGIPLNYQMMSVIGRLLQPELPLYVYNVKNGRHVYLIIKGIGGGGNDEQGKATCTIALLKKGCSHNTPPNVMMNLGIITTPYGC